MNILEIDYSGIDMYRVSTISGYGGNFLSLTGLNNPITPSCTEEERGVWGNTTGCCCKCGGSVGYWC